MIVWCHGCPTSSPSELRQLEKQLLRHFRASAVLYMRCCVPVLAGGAARGTSGCFNHFVLYRRLHLLLRANVHRRHRRLALHLQLPQPAASQVRTARGTLLRLPSRRPVPLPLHHPDVPRVCAPRHRPLPRLHQQQAQAGSASGGESRSGGTQQPRAWTSVCHLPAGLHFSAAAAATGHICFRSSSAAATGHICLRSSSAAATGHIWLWQCSSSVRPSAPLPAPKPSTCVCFGPSCCLCTPASEHVQVGQCRTWIPQGRPWSCTLVMTAWVCLFVHVPRHMET